MEEQKKCKKFCSDQCRNTYNNRFNAISNSYIRKVNYILRKNRRIMEEIIASSEKDVKRVKRTFLLDKGFDFGYYTNIYKTNNSKYYYFCYEYGYNVLENNYLAIVRKEEYLK